MAPDRGDEKTEALKRLLRIRLRSNYDTVNITFAEALIEPSFKKDKEAFMGTLDLVQRRTDGLISWRELRETKFARPAMLVANTEYTAPTPLPPETIGAIIRITDPAKLDKYFEMLFESKEKTTSKKRLIERNELGDFTYNGRKIEMGDDTLHKQILDILLRKTDTEGFISYETIESLLVNEKGRDAIEDEERSKKRIQNAITSKQQGLFSDARVGNKPLLNKTLKGEPLVKAERRRKGLIFNNPYLN